MIKVIESNFDTFRFERAAVVDRDGAIEAHTWISGVECLLGTKETLINAGLAFCQPVDSLAAEWWPVYSDLEIDGRRERRDNITADPATVAAARHFAELQAAGDLVVGMEL